MERITYQNILDGMFQKLNNFEDFINQSSLNKSLLKLIKLRVCPLNRCVYCVDKH